MPKDWLAAVVGVGAVVVAGCRCCSAAAIAAALVETGSQMDCSAAVSEKAAAAASERDSIVHSARTVMSVAAVRSGCTCLAAVAAMGRLRSVFV